jgi:hypothetical protein
MTDADNRNARLLEELQTGVRELTRRSRKTMELLLHADFAEFGLSVDPNRASQALRLPIRIGAQTVGHCNVMNFVI